MCKWTYPSAGASVQAPATVSDSRGSLMCYAPTNPSNWDSGVELEFAVSLNSFDFATVGPWRYEEVPIKPTLSPGSGPIMGGTTLQIFGAAMRNIPDLACYFGARTARATWQSNSLATCVSPDLPSVASASLDAPPDSTPTIEVRVTALDPCLAGRKRGPVPCFAAAPC